MYSHRVSYEANHSSNEPLKNQRGFDIQIRGVFFFIFCSLNVNYIYLGKMTIKVTKYSELVTKSSFLMMSPKLRVSKLPLLKKKYIYMYTSIIQRVPIFIVHLLYYYVCFFCRAARDCLIALLGSRFAL